MPAGQSAGRGKDVVRRLAKIHIVIRMDLAFATASATNHLGTEGASVTLLALLLATALSIPLTLLLLDAAEKRLLHVAAPLHFSLQGFAILCSGMLIVLATIQIAVMLGMRRAVQETLAYE